MIATITRTDATFLKLIVLPVDQIDIRIYHVIYVILCGNDVAPKMRWYQVLHYCCV